MDTIVMKSRPIEIVGIKKNTSAKLLKDLEVGDKIQLSVPAISVGSSRGRSYAVDIKVERLNTGQYRYMTFNEMWRIYSIFDVEEANNDKD